MINTHNLEALVKNIVKIRLKNRDERRKLVGKLNNLNIKIKEKTLKISFTSLNIKDKVKS
ncbi:MAG: hypothetical protein HXM60_02585 [Megasphaera micronuciformis]|nr:hypothetical protein [Megasphaera micronuciformis]